MTYLLSDNMTAYYVWI